MIAYQRSCHERPLDKRRWGDVLLRTDLRRCNRTTLKPMGVLMGNGLIGELVVLAIVVAALVAGFIHVLRSRGR